jgi:DNA helicase-2/ATP-dependent DNA helicase PcrA
MSLDILAQLNEEQRKAVTETEGPLLILAGAGTGKTKVISSKILYLLLEKKVPSGNIAALTFTEKAADEMVTRVDEAMPLSYEEVTIKTFHGFCDFILRESGLEIGIDPGYTLLDSTQQWLFMKKNLYSFDLNYYRPLGNPSKFFYSLLNHFSRLKDEDIQPDVYLKYAQGLVDRAVEDVDKENALKSFEIANAYAKHHELMQKQGYMDFGDLQYYALRLLENRPSVLKKYQDRFKYILVDEYQDTNYAQNKLIFLLSGGSNNLTVVGDDDQSIYKWRGASLSNILTFREHYPTAKTIVLVQNYRSTQPILDSSYQVIQKNNPLRLEAQEQVSKKLISNVAAKDPVEVHHFAMYAAEVDFVIKQIQKAQTDGIAYKNMAILVRANQHAGLFVDALKFSDIPFTVRDPHGLMRFEEIKDVLALLRFIAHPHDDIAFFRLITLPLFDVPMAEALDLLNKAKKDDYEALFYYLRKQLEKEVAQSLPGLNEEPNWFKPYDLLNRMIDYSRSHSVGQTISEFLNESGYYLKLTEIDNLQNAEKIQHIKQFSELTKNFESEENDQSVFAFLEYLDLLEQAQGSIAAIGELQENAVSILTVHSSKGLEFDYVFLPSLVQQRFPSTKRSEPFEVPAELLQEKLPMDDQHLAEERRLFYVACTRARRKLFLSYSDLYEGKKAWKPSVFLAEIDSPDNISKYDDTAIQAEPVNLAQSNETLSDAGKLMYVPEHSKKSFSYSKIDTFETCPLKYKFRYLFEIPSPSAHAANFGSSVHETVNQFYQKVQEGEKPSMELLMRIYEECWISSGYESKTHMLARKKQGMDVMEKFYAAEEANNFVPPAYREKAFRLKIGEFTMMGRIDRIDKLADGTYEVVDYKTGTYKRGTNIDKDLQLSLYALACRDVFHIPVSKLSLYFLEDGLRVSTTRTSENLVEVQDEITKNGNEILNSQFLPTPGFHCSFCEFRVLCHAAE